MLPKMGYLITGRGKVPGNEIPRESGTVILDNGILDNRVSLDNMLH